ncbi:MAG: FtsX-like permease family protein [Bacteroidales bacterium]|nr:FtsX-like permease family protein [Bacteroidales bacterium]
MNLPFFIARKMGAEKPKLTGLVKAIAILSISLGLAVMIIAVSVVTGFQDEIRNKVIGFGSHIQITNFDYNVSYEARPISKLQDFYPDLKNEEGIKHIQVFGTKPGIIKTDDEIHGVIFKGIGDDFHWDFFREKLKQGNILNITDTARSDQIIISEYISRLLQLNIDDIVFVYFIQDPPRVRRFNVAGIYETGLEELDRIFILGDIGHLQRLNDWTPDQVGGFEVLIDNYRQMERMNELVMDNIPYTLTSRTIRQVYPQIFDWLALLDMNVYVIIIIMILVAGINMITTLLISVLEKTNLIGILKALGSDNKLVRKIFLYHAGFLIIRGLLLGNLLGIGLALLQQRFGIIKLSQESYFVDVVPINFDLFYILAINLGTFAICMAMLVIPSFIIAKVSPVKAITYR